MIVECLKAQDSDSDYPEPESQHRPAKNFKFPSRTFGVKQRQRSCVQEWFEKFKWLHYDIRTDVVLCYDCYTARKQGNPLLLVFETDA